MAINVNSGVVDTADRLADEIRQGGSDVLHLIDTQEVPFWSILQNLPSPAAKNVQVTWTSDRHRPKVASLSVSAASAATAFSLSTNHGVRLKVGDYCAFGWGEVFTVTGVTADDISVTRGVGEVIAASAASGAEFIILGPAYAQGGEITGYEYAAQANSGYNYAQLFRHPIFVTGTMAEIKRFGSSKKASADIAHRLVEHYSDIENVLFFGARSYTSDSGSGHPLARMGGVADLMANASILQYGTGGTTLNLAIWQLAVKQAFANGSKRKAVFAGGQAAMGLINTFGTNYYPNLDGRKVHGVKPDAFLNSNYGVTPVFIKNGWEGSQNNTQAANPAPTGNGDPSGALFLIDLAHVAWRPLRKTALQEDRQAEGTDIVGKEWMTEGALELSNPAAHALITGILG